MLKLIVETKHFYYSSKDEMEKHRDAIKRFGWIPKLIKETTDESCEVVYFKEGRKNKIGEKKEY